MGEPLSVENRIRASLEFWVTVRDASLQAERVLGKGRLSKQRLSFTKQPKPLHFSS